MNVYIGPYPKYIPVGYNLSEFSLKVGMRNLSGEILESNLVQYLEAKLNSLLGRTEQQVEVHIDRYDTFSLDATLTKVILPALQEFYLVLTDKNNGFRGYPCTMSDMRSEYPEVVARANSLGQDVEFEIWLQILRDMMESFSEMDNAECDDDFDYEREYDPEIQKKVQRGLDLFAKFYRNLWW